MIFQSLPLTAGDIDDEMHDLRSIVTIFGFSYKKNTSDSRMTPAAFVVNYLAKKGLDVKIHDP